MGLKSGSRDSGLDADEESDSAEGTSDTVDGEETVEATETGETGRTDSTTSKKEIPYKFRRSSVNENRSQIPFFLRESVLDAEEDFETEIEEILGESVYKSDYREAAIIAAHRNPERVCEVLREWGYDLD